jgi:thymidylate synthase ThyX
LGDPWKTRIVPPANNNERFISFYLSGSRGFSHEQVRHRFGISQRSTRYCDESASPWVMHPLMEKYLEETKDQELSFGGVTVMSTAKSYYDSVVAKLQPWLMSKGVDKLTARKQARGTARGFLGNALKTEMIFTASVNDWKIICGQRANDAADAEIRMMYEQVIDGLLHSQYVDEFKGMELVPARDGLGKALKA